MRLRASSVRVTSSTGTSRGGPESSRASEARTSRSSPTRRAGGVFCLSEPSIMRGTISPLGMYSERQSPGNGKVVPAIRDWALARRQTVLRRVEDELSPMPEVELLIHVVHVVADRLGRDGARTSDLLGAPAARNEVQDLPLTQAERAGDGLFPGTLAGEGKVQKRIHVDAEPVERRDGPLQHLARGAARQVSGYPSPEGVSEYRGVVVGVEQEEGPHPPP